MLVSIGLSTFFHALGVGGIIFFASSPLKPSLVQTGNGSVEMEFVVRGGGGEQQTLPTPETRKNIPFSSHPQLNEEDQDLEEGQIQNQKKEILEPKKQNHKSRAQFYVVPLPQISGAWVLLDQKEGLYPPPRYPRVAILNGWEGETIVQLNIDDQGEVSNIRIIQTSGYSILDEAVIKTLREWHFEKASPRILQVPVKFVLKRENKN